MGGNWYNINEQMNYWPAFPAGLSDLFYAYDDFNRVRMPEGRRLADTFVKAAHPENLTAPGTNGWVVGTGNTPYTMSGLSPDGFSAPGSIGLVTVDYWNWFLFTGDAELLRERIYPMLEGASRFFSKGLEKTPEGLYLAKPSSSPEQADGDWRNYHITVGSAFDQQMMYENDLHYIEASHILKTYEAKRGLTESVVDEELLARTEERVQHYDPFIIGLSGQIKEFREENYYGEYGEREHRHLSHLTGLANGLVITRKTPVWLDGAEISLECRGGDRYSMYGWAVVQRAFAYARIGDAARAKTLLDSALRLHFYNNMFGDYNGLFQVDHNFGFTAALGEMLLQSHEGAIFPLPACPFPSGSVRGLSARGNVSVDMDWKDGQISSVTLHAHKSEEVRIRAEAWQSPRITLYGKDVTFRRDGDTLSFHAEAQQPYVVTGFLRLPETPAPRHLCAGRTNLGVRVSWDPVPGATYRVLRACGSEPTYRTLAIGVRTTTFLDPFTDLPGREGEQCTYKVVASLPGHQNSRTRPITLAPAVLRMER